MTTMFQKELEYSATQMKAWANDPDSYPEMTALYAWITQSMNEMRAERDQDNIDEYFAERDAKNV